jgi:transposase
MESTGVYWIPLFEVLEQKGFDCLLISSRSLRRVPGRKSDVTDAQWIQTLHNYGLLESSFRPQADLIALRSLLRHRRNLVDHRSPHVLHMQKALLQMNIQLSQAVSDITGVTGQAILRAIVAGVREPKMLASLREPSCGKSEEEIAKALTGTWREEHLFVLKQALGLFDFYSQQILECDQEIERMYAQTRTDLEAEELQPLSKRKRNSHSKNQFHETEKIRGHLKRISGVDISLVDGMGVSLAQTVILECGTDMTKFPTEKHFCSWLGLAPKHEISGNKVLKNKTLKTKSRAGQAFRMAAQSVKQAECAFGVLYRRLRAKLGPSQATVATGVLRVENALFWIKSQAENGHFLHCFCLLHRPRPVFSPRQEVVRGGFLRNAVWGGYTGRLGYWMSKGLMAHVSDVVKTERSTNARL